MSLVFPQHSRMQRLRAYVRTAETVHLFTNDIQPKPTSAAQDFTEPAAALGYRPVRLHADSWRVEPSGEDARAISAPATWTFVGGKAVVHGHYALDADGTLLWAERFGEWEETRALGAEPVRTWHDIPFEVLRPNDRLELVLVIEQPAVGDA